MTLWIGVYLIGFLDFSGDIGDWCLFDGVSELTATLWIGVYLMEMLELRMTPRLPLYLRLVLELTATLWIGVYLSGLLDFSGDIVDWCLFDGGVKV